LWRLMNRLNYLPVQLHFGSYRLSKFPESQASPLIPHQQEWFPGTLDLGS